MSCYDFLCRPGGWVRKVENKAKLSPAVAWAWLSLAKTTVEAQIYVMVLSPMPHILSSDMG